MLTMIGIVMEPGMRAVMEHVHLTWGVIQLKKQQMVRGKRYFEHLLQTMTFEIIYMCVLLLVLCGIVYVSVVKYVSCQMCLLSNFLYILIFFGSVLHHSFKPFW